MELQDIFKEKGLTIIYCMAEDFKTLCEKGRSEVVLKDGQPAFYSKKWGVYIKQLLPLRDGILIQTGI